MQKAKLPVFDLLKRAQSATSARNAQFLRWGRLPINTYSHRRFRAMARRRLPQPPATPGRVFQAAGVAAPPTVQQLN
jgi:hypothetical protein